MGDWSAHYYQPSLSVVADEALGGSFAASNGASAMNASTTWPAVNRAILVPFTLTGDFLVTKFWWANGAAVAGNIDCGIYTVKANGGTLLANTTSTAMAGTNLIQTVTVTSFVLKPGSYYMALAASSTTAAFPAWITGTLSQFVSLGIANQTASVPLTTTASLVQALTAFVPFFGITNAAVM